MTSDNTLTTTADTRPATAAMKRFNRNLRPIIRLINRLNRRRPACGWRHRKGKARR